MSAPLDKAKHFPFAPQAASYDGSTVEEDRVGAGERIVTAAAVALAVLVVAVTALLMGMA